MKNIKSKLKTKELTKYLEREDFIDFITYKEDKWLQYANYEQKLIAFFGSIENAIKEFSKDEIFNNTNF